MTRPTGYDWMIEYFRPARFAGDTEAWENAVPIPGGHTARLFLMHRALSNMRRMREEFAGRRAFRARNVITDQIIAA